MSELNINSDLVVEIKSMIKESKQHVATSVNAAITLLYWHIGKRINEEILSNSRADYGKQIVHTLSEQLVVEFGKGWGEKHLRHCLHIAETFQNKEIIYAVSRELSWTHLRSIIYIDEPFKRTFYLEMCKLERWSTRVLQERINSMLYERTAISKKPELTIQNELELLINNQQISPDLVFKDPYFLDFLGLKCLVAIELKLGKFEAAHKGQMELYLRWLEKYESMEGENPPIGLILCASKNQEHVELLQLENSNIKIAEFLTKLPDFKLIEQKLHRAIEIAKSKNTAHE